MYRDRSVTVEFFGKAGELYTVYTQGMLKNWFNGNTELEHGVISEMKGKSGALHFKAALASYRAMAAQMDLLDTKYEELLAVDRKGKTVPEWSDALAKLLAESPRIERIQEFGFRRGNAAGVKKKKVVVPPLKTNRSLLEAKRADLAILRKSLKEVIDAFQSAIPLAERREFVKVMLSGRNAFGDKMPEFTEMVDIYQRSVTQMNLLTIDATMQVYPKGWEWLK